MLTQVESPDHVPFNLIRHDALSLSGDSGVGVGVGVGAGAGAVVVGPVRHCMKSLSEHWLLGPHFPVRHCMISFLQSNEKPALTI